MKNKVYIYKIVASSTQSAPMLASHVVSEVTPGGNDEGDGKAPEEWLLKFANALSRQDIRRKNNLLGWVSAEGALNQVRLKFSSKNSAVQYAESKNYDYEVTDYPLNELPDKGYADNFLFNRRKSWTH